MTESSDYKDFKGVFAHQASLMEWICITYRFYRKEYHSMVLLQERLLNIEIIIL